MPPPTPPANPLGQSVSKWFAEEVQPHEAALRGYLRQQFPSVEADDVIQESYEKLWKVGTARKIAY